MTRKPLTNALFAMMYIIIIVSVMNYIMTHTKGPDTILAPIGMLSLLTLSAATMGYLFLYEPFQLYFDGKKKQAADFLLQTIGFFGGITALIFIAILLGLFK